MKYIDADRLKAEIERRKQSLRAGICSKDAFTKEQKREMLVAREEIDRFNRIIDSLQQEPIEKDEETEKLIVCDIIEATIARINGGKKDEEKEENIMREKISYLRDLGLKNHDN